MFDLLAKRYDLFNRLASLSLDRRWRRAVIDYLPAEGVILDVGTGTGDLAIEIKTSPDKKCKVIGMDFSGEMLKKAGLKCRNLNKIVFFINGNANSLPVDSEKVTAVTNAFVLRNLYRGKVLKHNISECYRVLEPGGKIVFLDLTRPANVFLRAMHKIYMKLVLPLIGHLVFRQSWPKSYLKDSIEEFLSEDEFIDYLRSSGFGDLSARHLGFGIATVFVGVKSA